MNNSYDKKKTDKAMKDIYEIALKKSLMKKDYVEIEIKRAIEKFYLERNSVFDYLVNVINSKEIGEKFVYGHIIPFYLKEKEKTILSYLNKLAKIGFIRKDKDNKYKFIVDMRIPTNLKAKHLKDNNKIKMFKRRAKLKQINDF